MNRPRPFTSYLFSLSILALLASSISQVAPPLENIHEKVGKKVGKKSDPLPPCQACRNLVNSFNKGLEDTARGKFEGGDADWEESRLKNYANSELRLVEIQERLCSNVEKAQEQCHTLSEEHESTIEDWWFKERKTEPDLHNYLCIKLAKVCCPPNHFGPDCSPCEGGVDSPCNGHGKCKGNGTRKGSGECKCDAGYTGELCNECAKGYYINETKTADDKIDGNCVKCHKSCKGHCREGGPKGCEVCDDGYQHHPEFGCTDVDECVESNTPPCSGNTFCANTDGSFICMDCDKVCNGCTADGPDMCIKCAKGYKSKDGVCIASENNQWKKSLHANFARYVTYVGFLIAIVIISKRNQLIAYIVASVVVVYVAIAEYSLGDWEEFFTMETLKTWLTLV